jgi:threonine/homoserine/homoserine lactone efflux protein
MAGIVSALGIGAGCLVHISAAAAGLSALMMAVPVACETVRYLGAAYLVYLGLRMLLTRRARVAPSSALPSESLQRIFWQGVVTNVLNPKVALFFLAFLPQFTSAARGSLALQFLVLGVIFDFNGTLVNLGYALVASRLGDWLRTRWGATRLLDRMTGVVFLGLGLRLAFLRRS